MGKQKSDIVDNKHRVLKKYEQSVHVDKKDNQIKMKRGRISTENFKLAR